MITLPESTRALEMPSVRARRGPANPVRRGPVLLATDGTGRSGAVVVAARLLAEHLDVPLEVVSVLPPTSYETTPDMMLPIDPVIDEVRRDTRETAVSDYVGRYSGGATPPRIHVRFGDATMQINQFAHEISATMIVVGAAPHRRLGGIRRGDRAAHVLRASPCPVLSVPPTFTILPRMILVAVDFGPSSVRAAQAALLTVGAGGTVVLTHVLPPLVRPSALSAPNQIDRAENAREMFERLREELRPCVPAGVRVTTRILTDDADEGILESAETIDADLIAVGTRGAGPLTRLLFGSVAENVLHDAQTAVLAAPPPPADEAAQLWRRITGTVSSRDDE